MGKTLIKVNCIDQRLLVSTGPVIASGGRNENEIVFSFCPLWDGYTKVATFYRDKENVYSAIIDGDDRCVIPWEVLANAGEFYFGVFGVKGDIQRTAHVVKYKVFEGAISEDTTPSDPTPDIYTQIISAYNEAAADLRAHVHGAITNDGKLGTVSGRIITTGTDGKMEASTPATARTKLGLAKVAASGSYTDLIDLPEVDGGVTVDGANAVSGAAVAAFAQPVMVKKAVGDGAIAVEGTAEHSFVGLRIYGKTAQDGTPTPDAPVELVNVGDDGNVNVSACGKNLLNSDFLSGWFTSLPTNSTGSVRQFTIVAGTYTISVATNTGVFRSNVIAITLIDTNGNRVKAINGVDAGGTSALNDSVTFSLSDDEAKRVAKINVYYNAQADTARTDGEHLTEMQIEYGTKATKYEPYASGGTLTISTPNGLPGIPVTFDGNYMDENGQQWVCDEIDLARGVYVRRVGRLMGSQFKWSSTNQRWYHVVEDPRPEALETTSFYPIMCNMARFAAGGATGTCRPGAQTSAAHMMVYVSEDTDISDLVMYYQCKPVETALSAEVIAAFKALHTHKPTTNVLNDSGAGMEVKCMSVDAEDFYNAITDYEGVAF